MIEVLSTRSLSDEARTDANGDHVVNAEARQIAVTVMAIEVVECTLCNRLPSVRNFVLFSISYRPLIRIEPRCDIASILHVVSFARP
jgi:hypothetical protein